MRLTRTSVLVALSGTGLALSAGAIIVPIADIRLPTIVASPLADTSPSVVLRGDSLADVIVERDPFRVGRRAARLAYDPTRPGEGPTAAVPKPALTLTGIIWDAGGNPSAVLEGLPGIAGPRVVRQEERVAGLEVRSIRRDRVVVVGLDTSWTLNVQEPWR